MITHIVPIEIDGEARFAERRIENEQVSWLTSDSPQIAVCPDYMEAYFVDEKFKVC